MNNYKKVLSAVAGLSLVSAAGMFAQEAELSFADSTSQTGSDFFAQVAEKLTWSVNGFYGMDMGAESGAEADLVGLDVRVYFSRTGASEAFLGISYGVGEVDDGVEPVDITKATFFGGYNRVIKLSNVCDLVVGGLVGVSQTNYSWTSSSSSSSSSYSYNEYLDTTYIVGGLNAGIVYALSEETNLRIGAEYSLPLVALNSDYYDDAPGFEYLNLSAGFEFKF